MSIGTQQLINEYRLEMVTPGCFPGAPIWRAEVTFETDISRVLPYLNAELGDTSYNHHAQTLLYNGDNGRRYAFRPHEIDIAPAEDRETAVRLCDDIVSRVNDIWARRNEITPDFQGKAAPPDVLEVRKLLPGTNCKECGYATCMAFAAALSQGKANLSECPHILVDEFAENRNALLGLLGLE
ncbi:MAG: (Fe-S)-binding protein [Dehalococcoidia bacterium]